MKFIPHKYQEYAISFIEEHPMSILLLDMGLGRKDHLHTDGNFGPDV